MFKQRIIVGRVVRWKMITTDASLSGWGALCNGRLAFGVWSRGVHGGPGPNPTQVNLTLCVIQCRYNTESIGEHLVMISSNLKNCL